MAQGLPRPPECGSRQGASARPQPRPRKFRFGPCRGCGSVRAAALRPGGRRGSAAQKWLAFAEAASKARGDFPDAIAAFDFDRTDERNWLGRSDHSIFFPEIWQREHNRERQAAPSQFHHAPEARTRLARAEAALRSLLKEADANPSSYYAVLALDGDQIGRWLSGERAPAVASVLSPGAVEYFRKHLPGPDTEMWLASPRPLSPSWHLQFSEALANFGLHVARRIVEQVHHGQLIYSGGDDVLAMLPADEAIACAVDLRAAFQGRQADMSAECRRLFRDDAPEGFLWLGPEQVRPGEPTWPLLVPGPRMTVSVGLALGHVKEPLQDMIQEAQKAEKRAKAPPERLVFHRAGPDPAGNGESWKPSDGWNRDALAVTLFKRSGETLRWGARFGSAAFDLLATLRQHFRAPWHAPRQPMPITGRFPYQLAALLGAYEIDEPLSPELRDIALREFDHVVSRQAKKLPDKTAFRHQAERYLDDLIEFSWDRPAKPGLPPCPHVAARSLRPFINLFLLEAFIRRQAD
ncbi:MAG: type III-B CRISPR-associated protein Cas10/Cmr2 [Verrucomicrobia bacterium]|nr:type III-B CRISPR-associated protein Cas10/Cmr2 [Verrucomicrobiota bacterium]